VTTEPVAALADEGDVLPLRISGILLSVGLAGVLSRKAGWLAKSGVGVAAFSAAMGTAASFVAVGFSAKSVTEVVGGGP
jgi:hypothetical protein